MKAKSQGIRVVLLLSVFITLQINLCGQNKNIEEQRWIHGSQDCDQNTDEGLQVVKYDQETYIIRQNKCLNYEAPFLYLFIGNKKAVLVDTGAESADASFPLYESVRKILTDKNGKMLPLVVVHSHGHGDHYGGDHQFKNKPNIELVPPTKKGIVDFFSLSKWPSDEAHFELGQRELVIIPIPGHDEMSIAIYDPQTQWLLTGDTIYPGRLYVRDVRAFCSSIARLDAFSKEHPVRYLMGNHIEMTTTKRVDYPTGTTYQPEEHPLPLGLTALRELSIACERIVDKFVTEIHNDFIIVPK